MSVNGRTAREVDPVRVAFVNFLRERRGLPAVHVPLAERYPRTAAWHVERLAHEAALERIRAKREIERETLADSQASSVIDAARALSPDSSW